LTFTAAITIIITKFEMRVTVKSGMSSLLYGGGFMPFLCGSFGRTARDREARRKKGG